ncbi:hypothetical protein GGR54DRAFT_377596 [Hypoxylon sp. NC1633]|nr:hypothetical protein GGR54DRAFT_377596 [Hypoxylon sp. NC1633]
MGDSRYIKTYSWQISSYRYFFWAPFTLERCTPCHSSQTNTIDTNSAVTIPRNREDVEKYLSNSRSGIDTGIVRESIKDNDSFSPTAESHESEPLSSDFDEPDGNAEGRSTPRTFVSESMPNPNNEEESLEENHVVKKSLDQHEALLALTSYNGISSRQAVPNQLITDIEAEYYAIDLDIGDVKPHPNIVIAVRQAETVIGCAPICMGDVKGDWYHCETERDSINSIYLHTHPPKLIYRWTTKSVITFNVNCGSFHSLNDATYAAAKLDEAANEWNKGIHDVCFKKVANDEPSVFQLTYGDGYGYERSRLADAFFPGDPQKQQLLYVYPPSFDKERDNYGWIANIFCHELGHILGLRHEFAQSSPKEQKHPSKQLGENNSMSVMNYFDHPSKMRIQESDYRAVNQFYRSEKVDDYTIVPLAPRNFTPGRVSELGRLATLACGDDIGEDA